MFSKEQITQAKLLHKALPGQALFNPSFSFLKAMAYESAGNPKKAIYNRLNPSKRTGSQRLGHVVECYVSNAIDPSKNPQAVFVYDIEERPEPGKAMTSKLNKAWKQVLQAQFPQAELVEKVEHADFLKMQAEIHSDPFLKDYIGSLDQSQITKTGYIGGIAVKGILDFDLSDRVTDVKTCTHANGSFNQLVRKHFWDVQGVIYCKLSKKKKYSLLAIETKAPHCYNVFNMEEGDQNWKNAETILNQWLTNYKRCVRENAWGQGYQFYSGALWQDLNVNRYIPEE